MNSAATTPYPIPDSLAGRTDQMFPTLTPAQMERVAAHGRLRTIRNGEVLAKEGDLVVPFFVVLRGQVEVVRTSLDSETQFRVHGPGQFNGEMNLLSGRRTLGTARVIED